MGSATKVDCTGRRFADVPEVRQRARGLRPVTMEIAVRPPPVPERQFANTRAFASDIPLAVYPSPTHNGNEMVARRTRCLNRLRPVFDRQLTAANAIDIAVASHPDSAVFHLDQELPYRRLAGRDITPRRLCAFVDRVGDVLRGHGLQRRERVAIFKTNGPDYFFLALAVIRAGGIAVPVNPGMECGPLSRYLAHCQAAMIVTDAVTFRARQLDPADFPTVRLWLFAGPAPS